jgi:hypothetical protein
MEGLGPLVTVRKCESSFLVLAVGFLPVRVTGYPLILLYYQPDTLSP